MQVFQNPEFGKIRTVAINGEPWLVGKDVATALRYKEPSKAAREKVDPEDRGVSKIDTPSGTQQMTIINESGLYSLILSSKLPSAKKFKRWVTSEVLPSIRRTGGYNQPGAQTVTMEQMTQFAAAVVTQAVLQMSQSTASSRYQEPENHPKEEPTVRRRGQLSSIERLPPNLRREVDEMLCDERCIYADIVNRLKEEGISISTASVCRYAQRNRLFPSCGDE